MYKSKMLSISVITVTLLCSVLIAMFAEITEFVDENAYHHPIGMMEYVPPFACFSIFISLMMGVYLFFIPSKE